MFERMFSNYYFEHLDKDICLITLNSCLAKARIIVACFLPILAVTP